MGSLLRKIMAKSVYYGRSTTSALETLEKGKAMSEGTERTWSGRDYVKKGGKWVEKLKGREKRGEEELAESEGKEKKPAPKQLKGEEDKVKAEAKVKKDKGKGKEEKPKNHIESLGLGKDLKKKFSEEEWSNIGTDVKKQDDLISSLVEDKHSSGVVDRWMSNWEELYSDNDFQESQEDIQALLESESKLSSKEKALLESVKDVNNKLKSANNAAARARRDRLGMKKKVKLVAKKKAAKKETGGGRDSGGKKVTPSQYKLLDKVDMEGDSTWFDNMSKEELSTYDKFEDAGIMETANDGQQLVLTAKGKKLLAAENKIRRPEVERSSHFLKR